VEYLYRKENPGLAMSGIIKLPSQTWHSEIYFNVRDDIVKQKRHLLEAQQVNAEIAEMVRLYKSGRSFLESGFHVEQTRELTDKEKEEKQKSVEEARLKMQII
jgi:hypothetical protein